MFVDDKEKQKVDVHITLPKSLKRKVDAFRIVHGGFTFKDIVIKALNEYLERR